MVINDKKRDISHFMALKHFSVAKNNLRDFGNSSKKLYEYNYQQFLKLYMKKMIRVIGLEMNQCGTKLQKMKKLHLPLRVQISRALCILLLISSCNGNHLIDDRKQHQVLVDYTDLSQEDLFHYYDTLDKVVHWSKPKINQKKNKECSTCYIFYKDVTLQEHLDDRQYFFTKYPCIMFTTTYYSHTIGIDICKDGQYLETISKKDSTQYVEIFNEEVVECIRKFVKKKKHIGT